MAMNPYEKYQQQSILTMTQGEMLVRLYEEVINQLSRALKYIELKDVQGTNQALQKCQRIINHLSATLDHKYEVSASLSKLYEYFLSRLLQANLKKDPEPIREVLPLVVELKDTFIQGEKLSRMKHEAK